MSHNDDTNRNNENTDIVIVSGPDGIERTLPIFKDTEPPLILISGNDTASQDGETVYEDSLYMDEPRPTEYRLDIETDHNIWAFDKMLKDESRERQRRRNRTEFMIMATATLAESMSRKEARYNDFKWTQKTIYTPPEPDHNMHATAAEEKRKRKAEKLKKLSEKKDN